MPSEPDQQIEDDSRFLHYGQTHSVDDEQDEESEDNSSSDEIL